MTAALAWLTAQSRPLCPCGCGYPIHKHVPIRLPHQRTNRES
ncbi:hypothetical protein ABZW30_12605 [Kitasatospora sp. NPDC004669]